MKITETLAIVPKIRFSKKIIMLIQAQLSYYLTEKIKIASAR